MYNYPKYFERCPSCGRCQHCGQSFQPNYQATWGGAIGGMSGAGNNLSQYQDAQSQCQNAQNRQNTGVVGGVK